MQGKTDSMVYLKRGGKQNVQLSPKIEYKLRKKAKYFFLPVTWKNKLKSGIYNAVPTCEFEVEGGGGLSLHYSTVCGGTGIES